MKPVLFALASLALFVAAAPMPTPMPDEYREGRYYIAGYDEAGDLWYVDPLEGDPDLVMSTGYGSRAHADFMQKAKAAIVKRLRD